MTTSADKLREAKALTPTMAAMLWKLAQHKHGRCYVSRHGGELQVADGLVRRGLVRWSLDEGRGDSMPAVVATDDGRGEIKRRFPVSPFALGTYVRQPGGWSPHPLAEQEPTPS